ncbi:MAG: hypothetical protein ACYC46_02685 [Acidobacteriaceae bacterium]
MTLLKHSVAGLLLAILLMPAAPAHALLFGKSKKSQNNVLPARKLTAEQNALIDKAIVREKAVIKALQQRTPIVETYIQNMRPDPELLQVPDSDKYFLSRIDFGKVVGDKAYVDQSTAKHGFFKGSLAAITGLTSAFKMDYVDAGFVNMILIDDKTFDRQHYNFGYVRQEFLGTVRTSVFDVQPKPGTKKGLFFGRIWVEDQDGNIVRFNGSFTNSNNNLSKLYFHFDSWRTNVQPDLWLPNSVYVEESTPSTSKHASTVAFKAVSHVWGYVLKVPSHEADQTTMEIDNATDASNDSQDVSPLGAQRAWVQQAEDNVIDRLYQAGLLDAPSDFDKILEQIANNILIENNIPFSGTVHCRIMLTSPLESLAVGNTIILSKGLIDTLSTPSASGDATVANLASVIAFQLAHIILGHRLDTRYAFNDRLLFPDSATFERIPMHHTDADNEAAAKKAMQLLAGSEFKDKLASPGLFLKQLEARGQALQELNQPRIGDSLFSNDSTKNPTFWMTPLLAKAPKLDMNNLNQQAAMPLGTMLKSDPWTDQLIQMHAKPEPLLSARDKMPFEVTPIYLKLSYYKAPEPAANTNAPATGTATPPAAQPANTPAPAGNTPANGQH